MIASTCRAASLFGAGVLLISPASPESLALWGILITAAGSLLRDIISRRSDRLKAKQQHEFDVADRLEAAEARAAIAAELRVNTALTKAASVQLEAARASVFENVSNVGAKADAAYEVGAQALGEANSVNAKIAAATAALAKSRNTP